MKVMYCNSCEKERDQLRARIAELEAEIEKLKEKHSDDIDAAFERGVHAGQESCTLY